MPLICNILFFKRFCQKQNTRFVWLFKAANKAGAGLPNQVGYNKPIPVGIAFASSYACSGHGRILIFVRGTVQVRNRLV